MKLREYNKLAYIFSRWNGGEGTIYRRPYHRWWCIWKCSCNYTVRQTSWKLLGVIETDEIHLANYVFIWFLVIRYGQNIMFFNILMTNAIILNLWAGGNTIFEENFHIETIKELHDLSTSNFANKRKLNAFQVGLS